MHGIITVEAIRKAQEKYGKGKPMTGEQIRWGIENLNITEARLKELGAAGFMQPLKVTLPGPRRRRRGQVPAVGRQEVERDHRLDHGRPASWCARWSRQSAAQYAKEKNITPRDCSKES